MSDINVSVISGRLTAKPELRFTQSGTAVASMRLASNRVRGEKQSTAFIDVKAFGKLAEILAQHKDKGDQISIQGSIAYDQWETREGEKRSKVYLIADQVSFGSKARAKDEPAEASVEGEPEPVDESEAPAPSRSRRSKPAPAPEHEEAFI